MGVLATTVPSVQNLFAIVGTQISSMLQPIERSCTDNGIETTVVAAMNDNDMVDIYVAVKDLEGSRINERTNLADVQLSGIAMTPMVQMVQFDEKTATATFRIEGVCGEDLNGKKSRFPLALFFWEGPNGRTRTPVSAFPTLKQCSPPLRSSP